MTTLITTPNNKVNRAPRGNGISVRNLDAHSGGDSNMKMLRAVKVLIEAINQPISEMNTSAPECHIKDVSNRLSTLVYDTAARC